MVYAFVNQKGGVGKSTLAFNFAAYCARNQPTLAIDLDPQGTMTKLLLADKPDRFAAMIFRGADPATLTVDTNIPNLKLIAGTLELEDQITQANISAIKKAVDLFASHGVTVVIDTRPSLNSVFTGTLDAADVPVIPMLPEASSVYDLPHMMEIINEKKKSHVAFIINNMDSRLKSHKTIARVLSDKLDVITPFLHASADIKESMIKKQTIFDFAPSSRSAREMVIIFNKLLGGKQNAR